MAELRQAIASGRLAGPAPRAESPVADEQPTPRAPPVAAAREPPRPAAGSPPPLTGGGPACAEASRPETSMTLSALAQTSRLQAGLAARLAAADPARSSASSTSCSSRRCASARRRCSRWSRTEEGRPGGHQRRHLRRDRRRSRTGGAPEDRRQRAVRVAKSAIAGLEGDAEGGRSQAMNSSLLWRGLLILAARRAVAVCAAYPPKEKINLGLDLRGGMHLVLRVRPRTRCAPRPTRTWSGCAGSSPRTASPACDQPHRATRPSRSPASPPDRATTVVDRSPTTGSAGLGLAAAQGDRLRLHA